MPGRRATDEDLIAAGVRMRQLKADAAALEAEAHQLQLSILHELERRSADEVEHGGLKLRRVVSTRTTYDVEAARARLKPAQLRRLVVPGIQRPAVLAELESGRISGDDVAAFSVETSSAPYVRVSGQPSSA